MRYARPSDYGVAAVTAAAGPGLMLLWERIAPSHVGKGGFAPVMRLSGVIGLGAGFLTFYQRSIRASIHSAPLGLGYTGEVWLMQDGKEATDTIQCDFTASQKTAAR